MSRSNCAVKFILIAAAVAAGGVPACVLMPKAASAQQALFSPDPAWNSADSDSVRCLAVGDIDRDGDLDLVCGDYGGYLKLYLNNQGSLSSTPAWVSSAAHQVRGIALGDIDGDGYCDIVCGNYQEGNSLYWNEGGSPADLPDWSSIPASRTTCIMAADINGDSRLDLICGNYGQGNTIYFNQGEVFSTTPGWTSGRNDSTEAVAVADLDGDGSLDAVFGNFADSNTVYFNSGGLSSFPGWISSSPDSTLSVSTGDLDGNGDIDIVFGSRGRNSVYLNNGGAFPAVPDWLSSPANETRSVSLGDVDNDGDPDLACGNIGREDAVYLNSSGVLPGDPEWTGSITGRTAAVAFADISGNGAVDLICGGIDSPCVIYNSLISPLSDIPGWTSSLAYETRAVTAGDIDGDGRDDLICGNENQKITLYAGAGSSFEADTSWSSGLANMTTSVVLEDIDGDHDLDLVCGYRDTTNVLYRNSGGVLSRMPVWSSTPENQTLSIAVGDINSDGRPDLACGNSDQINSIYLNTGAAFSKALDWESIPTYLTTVVALGDINSDGYPDLVCGNNGDPGTLYLNDNGVLDDTEAWASDAASTYDIAIGDINGDGLVDLACGIPNAPNTVYLNTGVILESVPSWHSSESWDTRSIALADVDGDGDLDLIGGEFFHANSIYLNNGGMLADTTSWFPSPANRTRGIYTCDVDGDGDEDLICGNLFEQNTLYHGTANPAFKADPAAPSGHLPNNTPFLESVDILTPEPDIYRISFSAVDVESDPVFIIAEFQYRGDPAWSLIDTSSYGLFSTSPAGTPGSIDWDTSALSPDMRDVVVRLRAVENPGRVAAVQRLSYFRRRIGYLQTEFSAISVSPDSLIFPLVSMGDSVSLDLTVSNTGDAALNVTAVTLPSSEMSYLAGSALPLNIPPGSSEWIRIWLKPRDELNISGDVAIISNAPAAGTVNIPVVTDIRISRPEPDSTTSEYIENKPISVEARLPESEEFAEGTLYYRLGGGRDYTAVPVESEDQKPRAVIPDSAAGPRGVEYWMEVNTTLNNTFTDPPVDPERKPRVVQVTYSIQEELDAFPMDRYVLWAPGRPDDYDDTPGEYWGAYDDISRWRCFRWLPRLGRYAELSEAAYTEDFHIRADRSFWIILGSKGEKVPPANYNMVSTSTAGDYELALQNGWNMTGNPFEIDIPWDSIRVNGIIMAEAERVLIDTPVSWSVQKKSYDRMFSPRVFRKGTGYWIYSYGSEPVVCTVPPLQCDSSLRSRQAGVEPEAGSGPEGWRISIAAETGPAADRFNFAGVQSGAAVGRDRSDRPDLPLIPAEGLSVYFPHGDWDTGRIRLREDYREEIVPADMDAAKREAGKGSKAGALWCFDIAKNFSLENSPDRVKLSFSGIESVPAEFDVILLDRELGSRIDLREKPCWEFYLGERDYVSGENETRFVLLAGTADFFESERSLIPPPPAESALHQNYPNPFNPSTVIRYDLASPGRVELNIYDVRGALVKTIFSGYRAAGRYVTEWNGINRSGERASSGIYLCRLKTGGNVLSRKMVLIR